MNSGGKRIGCEDKLSPCRLQWIEQQGGVIGGPAAGKKLDGARKFASMRSVFSTQQGDLSWQAHAKKF